MSSEHVNITLGTAGHIDHGKTALIRCLTGCETDRLKAEKERGMSIDLGFAPCTLSDLRVGIVDVPGHENFVKTMVAGASGMDGVILVVAADDGVMPQTREHMEILTLLGLRHGLVALTKVDRVEPDRVEGARADIEAYLQGTFLEDAPILPISSITGEGFELFYQSLEALVQAIKPKRIDGVFRLPLDRAFSAKGFGTVVAGIPVSGSAQTGDEVVLLPDGLKGRIKRIEVYGQPCDTVMAGECAALNVGHWNHRNISRGNTLTVPGYFSANQWCVCSLRLLRSEGLSLKNGAHVKFHSGTSEVNAMVYAMKGNRMESGQDYLVQIKTTSPVVVGPGDRFILRSPSPVQTIGGGMVVEATANRLRRTRPNIHEDLLERADAVPDECRFVEYCVKSAESLIVDEARLAARTKVPRHRLQGILVDLASEEKVISLAGGHYIHPATIAEAGRRILEVVGEFHGRSPESPGITMQELRQSFPLDKAVVDAVIAPLMAKGRLVESKQRLALSGHRATFRDADAQRLDKVESLFREAPFRPPRLEEVIDKTGIPANKVERIVKILVEHDRLVAVEKNLLFHREAVDRAGEIMIEYIRKEGKLESVQFKYLLDTTRKFAIPLLDYFDRVGLTRRTGNTRFLKEPPAS